MADRRPAVRAVPGPPAIRRRIARIKESGIRVIANATMGREDVIPLWFGESDQPTPEFICDAAAAALRAGDTFYAPNRGKPELVTTIAEYENRLYAKPIAEDRIVVTNAGMNALMIAAELLVDPGDEVICVTPVWPNFLGCVEIMDGHPVEVALAPKDGRWHLDLDHLFGAVTARTRAIYLSTPNNPTGWMAERDTLEAILEFCRHHGLWVVSDEVYARVVYDRDVAPSFLDLAEPDDAVIVVNSFSKSWSMTGWRLGWVVAPAEAATMMERLNEFNVASPAAAAQTAGITAIRQGEPHVLEMRAGLAQARDTVMAALGAIDRVELIRPDAAFYAFFGVHGMNSPTAMAWSLVEQAGVGLAPGDAFGAGGDNYLRICYAKSPDLLETALDRLAVALR